MTPSFSNLIPKHWGYFDEPKEVSEKKTGALHGHVNLLARNGLVGFRRELKTLIEILEDPGVDPNATENGASLLECALINWNDVLMDLRKPSAQLQDEVAGNMQSSDNTLQNAVLALPGDEPWNGQGYIHPCEIPAAILLNRGADPFPQGRVDLLGVAASHSSMLRVVDCMLRHPNRPDWKNIHYNNPNLKPLIHTNHLNVLKCFIRHGCPVDMMDYSGNTGLMGAKKPEVVQYFLAQGANPLSRNKAGKSVAEHLSRNQVDWHEKHIRQGEQSLSEVSQLWEQAVKTFLDKATPDKKPSLIAKATIDAARCGWSEMIREETWTTLDPEIQIQRKAQWAALNGAWARNYQQENSILDNKILWRQGSIESSLMKARLLVDIVKRRVNPYDKTLWTHLPNHDDESDWREALNNLAYPQEKMWFTCLNKWLPHSFDHPALQNALFPHITLFMKESMEKRGAPLETFSEIETILNGLICGLWRQEDGYTAQRAQAVSSQPETAAQLLETWIVAGFFQAEEKIIEMQKHLIQTPGWQKTDIGQRVTQMIDREHEKAPESRYWLELKAELMKNTLSETMNSHGSTKCGTRARL